MERSRDRCGVELMTKCTAQIVLNSMHRYQPRIHLVKWREHGGPITDLDQEEHRTYIFPESVFTAVTAYQNQLVSDALIHGLFDPSLHAQSSRYPTKDSP